MMMKHFRKFQGKLFFLLFAALSCVEPIDFDSSTDEGIIVIEGMITDAAPPYFVTVSKSMSFSSADAPEPVGGLTITLHDNLGASEQLVHMGNGVYATTGAIHGIAGNAYHITIETSDGAVVSSAPDVLHEVGSVDSIKLLYDERVKVKDNSYQRADVFEVLVDAHTNLNTTPYVRWRFNGYYQVITTPEFHTTFTPPYSPYKDPLPCSGWKIVAGPEGSGGLLEQIGPCTCCVCWINDAELMPQVLTTDLVSDGIFKNVKVGEVPITGFSMKGKYLVEVEQMSMTKRAYDFFYIIRQQKQNATNIFQPPYAEIKGNLSVEKGNLNVAGIFWASSVSKHIRFIYPMDVPYPVPPPNPVNESCIDFFDNSSLTKPANWE